MVGNWTLSCKRAGELQIHNSDGQQVGGPRIPGGVMAACAVANLSDLVLAFEIDFLDLQKNTQCESVFW